MYYIHRLRLRATNNEIKNILTTTGTGRNRFRIPIPYYNNINIRYDDIYPVGGFSFTSMMRFERRFGFDRSSMYVIGRYLLLLLAAMCKLQASTAD